VTNPTELSLAAIEQAYRDRTPQSLLAHQNAERVLPGGDTRESTFFRPYPLSIAKGEGARVWDVDGNVYLDAQANHTSLIHGHAHPAIVEAVRSQLIRGTVHGGPTSAITDLAGAICARVPSIEQLRFTISGTEAVMHALRAARAVTGRPKLLKFEGAYHGTFDGVEVSVQPDGALPDFPQGVPDSRGLMAGVLENVLVAPFNDVELTTSLIEAHASELAAVLVEPMMGRGAIAARAEFLHALRDLTARHGIVLIFDEVQTFRLARGGGQSIYNIKPDLTALGKIIGGGFPVGAFGGRRDIMIRYAPQTGSLHHSGTYNGNAITMVAGLKALELLDDGAFDQLNTLGAKLRESLQTLIDERGLAATVTGVGSYAWIHASPPPVVDYRSSIRGEANFALPLHLALLNRGIFAGLGPRFVVSTVMGKAEVEALTQGVALALDDVLQLAVR
jgi:glutamate-1-semialdehyde 2,1-aminomutase